MCLRCNLPRVTVSTLIFRLLSKLSMFNYQCLHFSIIGNISIVVHSTRMITCTTHFPASTSYADYLKVLSNFLHVDVTLNQRCAPVPRNILCYYISVNSFVPHVSLISTQSVWSLHRHDLRSFLILLEVDNVLFMLLTNS